MITHAELAAWAAAHYSNPDPPRWMDPVLMFTCVCGKVHLRESGNVCPCGEPFPTEHRKQNYR